MLASMSSSVLSAAISQSKEAAQSRALRRKELRGKPYDWREVDALLQLGEGYDGPPRFAEGMVEMQRRFTALAKEKDWI